MRLFRSFPNSNIPSHDHAALSRSALMMSRASYQRLKAGNATAPNRKAGRANRRRSGQALLLAVLLMVFAALLGSTFITVVSLNLNQTARQGNLSSARASANSGIEWQRVNLVSSDAGTKWRPEMLAAPPAPGEITYNFYYTSFERAQGWARTVSRVTFNETMPPSYPAAPKSDWNRDGKIGFDSSGIIVDRKAYDEDDWAKLEYYRRNPNTAVGTSGYSKVPDPRSPQGPAVLSNPGNASGNANAPVYLAQVKYLMPPGVGSNNSDPAKSGLLELSVIGLSEDNPSVFDRRIAYMQSTAQSPLTAAMRVVTNWDFANNTVPEGRVADGGVAVGASTIRLEFSSGQPLSFPFYIAIGGPVGQVVNAVPTASLKTVLITGQTTFANTYTMGRPVPVGQAIPQYARFQVAAAFGSPYAIDYNADGNLNPTTEAAALMVSQGGMPGAMKANGSVSLIGNPIAANLNSTLSLVNISASGLISNHNMYGANPRLFNANAGAGAFNATISQSTDATFPFVSADGTAPTAPEEKVKFVNDGFNALTGNVSDPTRQVRPFTPPSLTNADSSSRYRQVTKFSGPSQTAVPAVSSDTAGLYGGGRGVYIDNIQDVEKRYAGTGYVGLQADQTVRLLTSDKSTTETFLRLNRPLGAGSVTVPVNGSLEEKHIRGWIGPDEFRARGALVELYPAGVPGDPNYSARPAVAITRDALSDSSTAPGAPDVAKSWKDQNGDQQPYVYRKVLPWPENGVIFAEGNLRVRGGAFTGNVANTAVDPGRSITIVSNNNIYIEDSINAGGRKVVLLALKNVVVNPTSALSRVEAETIVSPSPAPASTTSRLYVNDPGLFRVNDWIEINNGDPRRVTAKVRDVNGVEYLQISPTLSTAPNPNFIDPITGTRVLIYVQATQDPQFGTGTSAIPYYDKATRIGRFTDIVQRRIRTAPGATDVRIAMRESATRRTALVLQADKDAADPITGALTTQALMSHKQIDPTRATTNPNSSVILLAEKSLKVDYQAGLLPATATYPLVLPATNATAAVSPNDLIGFEASLPQTGTEPPLRFQDENVAAVAPAQFPTDTDVVNGYETAPTATKLTPPYFFLAAVGNRFDFGQPAMAGMTLPDKKSILEPASYEIPMATSVQVWANGAASQIKSDHFDATGNPEVVNQLGFNPNFSETTLLPNPINPNEDALTTDQSFYTRNPAETAGNATSVENFNLNTDNVNYTLDTRTISPSPAAVPAAAGQYSLSFKLNNSQVIPGKTVEDFFVPGTGAGTRPIPYYRLGRLKLEGPTNPFNAAKVYENLTPAYTFDIRAFVYAQEGSWIVIPGGNFDDDNKIKTDAATGATYVDYNDNTIADAGEYLDADGIVGLSAGDGADLNRDGQLTREEQAAAYRLRRYNYQIDFTGAIMERQSATIMTEVIPAVGATPAVTTVGDVQESMDKWATINLGAGNFTGPTAAGSLNRTTIVSQQNNPGAAPGALRNITYTFDDDISNANDPAVYDLFNQDSGIQVPASPDLIYTG